LTAEQIKHLTAPEPEKPAKVVRARKTKKSSAPTEVKSSGGSVHEDAAQIRDNKPLFKSTVVWTTPLRLPVVQPYRTSTRTSISTNLQRIALQEPQVWDPVSKRKQLQAFPPNFIHSLDATHMLLSALKCSEEGMTFASIHDSFWTHACDINDMSGVLRDAFVAMHSEDIIGRLREEFITRYKDCMYMAAVSAKSPAGIQIIQTRKELKGQMSGRSGELSMEMERLRLLASEDAEVRAKGEAMVTPGSIVASHTDEAAFAAPVEMNGQKLGEIPESSAEIELEETEEVDAGEGAPEEEVVLATEEETKRSPKPVKRYPRKLYVWLPLTFPPVPEKGGFDVTRLRQSKYFFH
jgi:DNA-directed RNA polymerase